MAGLAILKYFCPILDKKDPTKDKELYSICLGHYRRLYTISQEIFEGYKFSWFLWLISNPQKLITSIIISIGVNTVKSTKILFHGNYKSKPISEIHEIL